MKIRTVYAALVAAVIAIGLVASPLAHAQGVTTQPQVLPVRVATTANITLSGTQTIDGVSVVAGDRVLVKNQNTGSQNGVYVVAAGTWARSNDFRQSGQIVQGSGVYVNAGTANANQVFYVTTSNPITPGSTSVALSANTSAAGITFIQEGAGAVLMSAQTKMRQFVNVNDFGADPTGVSDSTAAIQAANDAASASATEATCLQLTQGTYNVSGTITLSSGIGLCGAIESKSDSDAIGTLVRGTGSSGQVLIQVGNGSTNPNNNVIQEIGIGFANVQSSGAAIRVRNGHNVTLRRIRIGTGNFAGIVLEGGAGQYNYVVDNVEIGAGAIGIHVGPAISGSPAIVQGVSLTNIKIASMTQSCILLQHVGGLDGGLGVECLQGLKGLVMAPGNNEVVKGVNISGFIGDTTTEQAIVMAPTGTACVAYTSCGLVALVQIVNSWSSSSAGSAGITISSASGGVVDGVNLVGVQAVNNYGNGIELIGSNVKYVSITAPLVGYNNVGAVSKHGIEIGPNVSNWSIVGGCSGACGQFAGGASNAQLYGVNVNAGTSDYYNITNVNVTGNVTGGISDGAAGTNRNIYSNVGSPVQAVQNAWTLINGGTNAALVANNGGIVYSSASALAILSGTATANLPLLSGASTTPSWAPIVYPTSANSGGVACFTSSTVMASSSALAANALIIGGGAGVCPSGTSTAAGILSWIGTPSSANLAAVLTDETGSGLVVFNESPSLTTPSMSSPTISGTASGAGTLPVDMLVQSAWTTYTPTIGCGSGALTTSSATGRWQRVANTIVFTAQATITTNGTCATYLSISSPVTMQSSTRKYFGLGGETAVGGEILAWKNIDATTFAVTTIANVYPGGDGYVISISGVMESN